MGLMPSGELGPPLTGEAMKIPDIIGCMGWVAALLAAVAAIPIGGLFIGLLTPLPFIYYLAGLPLRYAAQLAGIVIGLLVLLSLVLGLGKLGLFCLEFGILGLWMAQAFQHRLAAARIIGSGTVVLIITGILAIVFTAIAHDKGPVEMLKSYLTENLVVSVKAYESMGVPADKAAEMKAYAVLLRRVLLKIYPSLMVVGSAFVVWANTVLSIRLFSSRGINLLEPDELSKWKAPEYLVWGVIIAGFSLFLPLKGIRFVALNLLIVFGAVYLFQGMAILAYFLNRFRAPSWVKVVLYFFIAIQQFFLVLLALAGLFDQWINFRKLGRED